jgi:hypothetical protein
MGNNDNLPDYVFGGSGDNWFRFGNVVVNNSPEGWGGLEKTWDYLMITLLTIGGIVLLCTGFIFFGIVLVGIGVWGFSSPKVADILSTIITWSLVMGVIIFVCIIISNAPEAPSQ